MKSVSGLLSKPAFLSAFFVFVLMLAGCNKNNAQSNSGSANSAKTDNSKPVIEFRKSPCFGKCPIYRAQIMSDGKINYQGVKFVDKVGDFTSKITTEQVAEILAEAERANFWTADSLYANGATDFPSRVLTLRQSGKTKTVRAENSEPAELTSLMKMVDGVIMEALREKAEPVNK